LKIIKNAQYFAPLHFEFRNTLLRDFRHHKLVPGVETPGYCQKSFRDWLKREIMSDSKIEMRPATNAVETLDLQQP